MKEIPSPTWDGRDVADLLHVSVIAPNRFRARFNERNEHGRIYGGQLLGQAVSAAARTVPEDRTTTCLQLVFLAGGFPEQPIEYEVASLQNGKRFASRNVRGSQREGRILCNASISFATELASPSHQAPAPDDCGLSTDPERLPSLAEIDAPEARNVERTLDYSFSSHVAIDMRAPYAEDLLRPATDRPRIRFWIKIRTRLADDAPLHAAAFAYLSDYWINLAASIGHVRSLVENEARLYVASLNHIIWYHRVLRADEWLLFDCASPSGAFGRGLSVGRVSNQSGDLVASAAQECLLAPITD